MVSPVQFNAMVQRTPDAYQYHQNEANKGQVALQNGQTSFEKEINVKLENVRSKDDTQKNNSDANAKDKGSNEYTGDGGKRRHEARIGKAMNETVLTKNGIVMVKRRADFDMKV